MEDCKNYKKSISLEFSPSESTKGLSGVACIYDELWLVNDEDNEIVRLVGEGNENDNLYKSGKYSIQKIVNRNSPPTTDVKKEELDLEGIDYCDGYLWLAGSHSLKRKNWYINKESEGNRCFLARIPLVKEDHHNILVNENASAQLRGSASGNELRIALQQDELLKQFLNIPAKENGLDIEGITVGKNNHIFLGLRGPVLDKLAIILQIQLEINIDNPSELLMMNINADNPLNPAYRKHFLDLGGLGIRDLCADHHDLLILAGPTMSLDGPFKVFRWKNAIIANKEVVIPDLDESDELIKLFTIPYDKDKGHAEGMTGFSKKDERIESVLVIYDSNHKINGPVRADIFTVKEDA